MYQLFRARQLGLSTRVFERGSGLGGTWYWNRYPGARCDVPFMAYSVSYMPELDQEWQFGEVFPTWEDILKYIAEIDRREQFSRDVTFNTSVVSARWQEDRRQWIVTTDNQEVVECRYLVMATGTLTAVPRTPDVPGIDNFEGRWLHTGRWPKEKIDFTGRNVAVVGTGSTGIQTISEVAKTAGTLTVYQRTPKFTIPAANRLYTTEEIAAVQAVYPEFRKSMRYGDYGTPTLEAFMPAIPDLLKMSAADCEALLEAMWNDGSFAVFFATYRAGSAIMSPAVNEVLTDFSQRKIKRIVKDPETAETLTPYGYPIGVNRLCLDTEYYNRFNQDNVFLVDTRKYPILEIAREGIRTAGGLREFDDIIFATGYDAMTGSLTSIDIIGKHGKTIREDWVEGPATYLGLQAHDYPNLFLVTAPGGPSVLSNAIVTGEQNVDFITNLIATMEANGIDRVEADLAEQTKWMEHVAEVAQQSLYREAVKANAWYTGKNVPGKKVVFMPYSGGVGTYEHICERVVADGYQGFLLSDSEDATESGKRTQRAR